MVEIDHLTSDLKTNGSRRPNLEQISYEGNFDRRRTMALHKIMYENGPGNGTILSLPFDQLVEHGVGHTIGYEGKADPRKVIELANRGCFSALALSIGQAEKYSNLIGSVPLLVKVDGHLLVGDEVEYPRHSKMASVERAVEAGADAIGFTFYVGEKNTMEDMERVSEIIEKSHRHGKPVFMWAYTRGPFIGKMGNDSLYWCAQGISVAESLGVDVVKQKFPMPVKKDKFPFYKETLSEKGYLGKNMQDVPELLKLEPEEGEEMSEELATKRLAFCSQIAPNLIKIASGGPKGDPKQVAKTTELVMLGGWEGVIVGRNLWGRPMNEALALNRELTGIMSDEIYARDLREPRFTKDY